jgi:anti-sigma B factor antagonist
VAVDVPFEVRIERDRRIVVRGEVDLSTAPELASAIASVAEGAFRVVVDLGGVTFIDSTGLGVLVNERSALEARNGAIVISSLSPVVETAFQVAGLERVFIVDGNQAADFSD